MTPCVMKKYDEMFGNNFNKAFKKNLHLIDSVTPGVASAASVTGKEYFLSFLGRKILGQKILDFNF